MGNNSSNGTDIQVYAFHQKVSAPSTQGIFLWQCWIPWQTSLVVIDAQTPIYLQYQDNITLGINTAGGTNLHYTFKYETLRE